MFQSEQIAREHVRTSDRYNKHIVLLWETCSIGETFYFLLKDFFIEMVWELFFSLHMKSPTLCIKCSRL